MPKLRLVAVVRSFQNQISFATMPLALYYLCMTAYLAANTTKTIYNHNVLQYKVTFMLSTQLHAVNTIIITFSKHNYVIYNFIDRSYL